MAANTDPVVVSRVIGDVVDRFEPSVDMSLYYDDKHVINGSDVKPSLAASTPVVTISGEPKEYYTLVMTDPDAPSPSEPTLREWAHWIVTDIPGGSTASAGKEILAYMPPRPPVGIHRYIMVLYKQKALLGFVAPPSSRAYFSTRLFANYHKLGMPVSTVYFNAHREPSGKKR